uniref:Uncharacterized protein n=1 Tax=Anguilla anguilla TaxID=7936 RepID=A0A0E9VPR7_ANGAN
MYQNVSYLMYQNRMVDSQLSGYNSAVIH